jgi:3',5'-cyclic AMP phosphodiesterase CpdA
MREADVGDREPLRPRFSGSGSMRLIHLADLHFGRVEAGAVSALLDAVHLLHPDLIVVSGDLTHRALRSQFRAAAQFVRQLPVAPICVPGNHDVPIWNPLARLARPFAGYRRWIARRVEAFFEDELIAIAALNTAHGWTWSAGRVREAQCNWLEQRFAQARAPLRLIVSHHPLDLPRDDPHRVPPMARRALQYWVEGLEVDLFLAGHLHRSRTALGPLRARSSRHAVFNQAGTAISDQHSGRGTAFTSLALSVDAIEVQHWERPPEGTRFVPQEPIVFTRGEQGWSVRSQPAA